MRWGFPSPPNVGGSPATDVRNVTLPCWRHWLKPEHRCLVVASSFNRYADKKPRKLPAWFAHGDNRPLFAYAATWRPWTGQWRG